MSLLVANKHGLCDDIKSLQTTCSMPIRSKGKLKNSLF